MASIPRITFTLADTRTIRLTINGSPAVLPIVGFSRPGSNTLVHLPDGTYMDVSETPEELAALWDAAAPPTPVVEREPPGFQETTTIGDDAPGALPPFGHVGAGDWEPVVKACGLTRWRRPLRRVE